MYLIFSSCFIIFRLLHELCTTTDVAYLVTCDVIREFAEDNVKYLELRTTPRDVPKTGMTKRSYIDAVLRAMKVQTIRFFTSLYSFV